MCLYWLPAIRLHVKQGLVPTLQQVRECAPPGPGTACMHTRRRSPHEDKKMHAVQKVAA